VHLDGHEIVYDMPNVDVCIRVETEETFEFNDYAPPPWPIQRRRQHLRNN